MRQIDLCRGWTFSLNGGPPRPVSLPHDFSIGQPRSPHSPMGGPGGWFQGGAGVYERPLSLPPAAKTVLVFEGSMGVTTVALNGEVLCVHPYGYTEFHVDVTGRLTGDDTLTVTVDHTALPDSRWYPGSGLYRPVWAALGGEVYIPLWRTVVTTAELSGDRAVIEVASALENLGEARDVPVSVEIIAPDGSPAARCGWTETAANGVTGFKKCVDLSRPALWEPDSPALYTAVLTAGEDVERTAFGLCAVSLSPESGLALNGRPLKLRGGCVHHDNGPLGACAHPDAERRKLDKLKAAGYNAVRSAHNPPGRAFLDACDELGLLVIDEAFDCWHTGKNPHDYHLWFDDWRQRDLTAMVLRDRNHPSVLMYSIGNEIPDKNSPLGAELSRQMADFVRSLDPTRPVTCAVDGIFIEGGGWQEQVAGLVNGDGVKPEDTSPEALDIVARSGFEPFDWGAATADFIAPLDVAGYNYLDYRYASDRVRFPERILMGTESFPKLMARIWRRVLENPHVIGDFTWTAWDYLGESGIGHAVYDGDSPVYGGAWPYHLATCGDFDICGNSRPQGKCRRVVWGLEQSPVIAVLPPELTGRPERVTAWGWSQVEERWTFPGSEGRRVRVDVYSNAPEVELSLNGEMLGRAGVVDCKAVFTVPYRPGTLRAVNLRNGIPAEAAELTTAGAPAALALLPEAKSCRTGGLLYLWAEIRDEQGRVVPWAETDVTAAVTGPAEVIVSASGDPETEHRYTDPTCRTWRGRALFILRGTAPGTAEAVLSAPGLAPAKLTFPVLP